MSQVKRDVFQLPRVQRPPWVWIPSTGCSLEELERDSWVTSLLLTKVWEQMKWVRVGCDDVTTWGFDKSLLRGLGKQSALVLIGISVAKYHRAGSELTSWCYRIFSGCSSSSYCTSLYTLSDPSHRPYPKNLPSQKGTNNQNDSFTAV